MEQAGQRQWCSLWMIQKAPQPLCASTGPWGESSGHFQRGTELTPGVSRAHLGAHALTPVTHGVWDVLPLILSSQGSPWAMQISPDPTEKTPGVNPSCQHHCPAVQLPAAEEDPEPEKVGGDACEKGLP